MKSLKTKFQQPLDPRQLKRIENVHGGFLYQHLYVVGCILLAPTAKVKTIQPERDEDVELLLDNRRVYIQVKKRTAKLQRSDIKSTLELFERIRNEHESGDRNGGYEFWIVCNTTISPKLERLIKSEEILSTVNFLFKGLQQKPDYLPPAWSSIEDALEWCSDIAETIPFCNLASRTLIWKLAALVQYASSGTEKRPHHSFDTDELPDLFEQLTIQLQQFPAPPTAYYPQRNEPDFLSDSRVRLIVGLSGSGKTAWASESASFCDTNVVYFDIGDTPSTALASTLSREIAGNFSQNLKFNLRSILLPGVIGIDSIRALDMELSRRDIPVVVVVDNVHKSFPVDLSGIINATTYISWILLTQPTPEQKEIKELLGVDEEFLNGWSIDTIATFFDSENCGIDPVKADRIFHLTGGLPLYTINFVKLSKTYYENNPSLLCDDLECMKHPNRTSQERILSRVCEGLSPTIKKIMAILTISDVSLSTGEVSEITSKSLCISEQEVFCSLREMTEWAIIQHLCNRNIIMHDSFRLIAKSYLGSIPSEVINQALNILVDILGVSILKEPDISRQRLYLRLLPLIGQIKTLIDLASNDAEMFAELGYAADNKKTILDSVESGELDNEGAFWALDTLAFWACQSHDWEMVENYINRMEKLISKFSAGRREKTTLSIKYILLCTEKKDLDTARHHFVEACELNKEHPEALRILRYDYAFCLYSSGKYSEAADESEILVNEYFGVLGLLPEDVFFKNPPEILEKIDKTRLYQDDLKHLADSLDLYAQCCNKQGLDSVLARINAFKFYIMACAWVSSVRLGQDFVDERLSVSDAEGARTFLEDILIPGVKDLKLLEHFIPVRSQYAVVLAYCGEASKALAEIESLKKFSISNLEYKREFENQCLLVDRIIKGEVVLPPRQKVLSIPENDPVIEFPKRKIGRNEKCPCGSGKKYKRCCGAN